MLQRDEFTRAAKRYGDMIYRRALTYTKNPPDAEDIAQEVLVRLYLAKKDFQSDDHLRFWLVRVTQNECRKKYRRKNERTVSLDEISELAEASEEDRGVISAVMGLDRKYRQVILLYYYEEYSIDEISALTRIPKGTVGTRLRRAREILKRKLEDNG